MGKYAASGVGKRVLTDRVVMAWVQRRLRDRKIAVHNALVRIIVAEALAFVSRSMYPVTAQRFLAAYAAGVGARPLRRRALRALQFRYSAATMKNRADLRKVVAKKLSVLTAITDAELVALRDLERAARRRGDSAAISAVHKAIASLWMGGG